MMEICAIIGLKQLETWPERPSARTKSAANLHEAMSGNQRHQDDQTAIEPDADLDVPSLILIKEGFGVPRNIVVKKLHEKGVMVRQYYEPCHQMPAYQYNPKYPCHVKLAVTEQIAEQVIALPVFDHMLPGDIAEIASALRSIQKENS